MSRIPGAIQLPFVAEQYQEAYVWFLIGFPLLLIVFFFVTLNFNHRVLYAPSDFKNEDNFFRSFRLASPPEVKEKLQETISEIEDLQASVARESPASYSSGNSAKIEINRSRTGLEQKTEAIDRYIEAQELVLQKLAKEYGLPVAPNVSFDAHSPTSSSHVVFDGIIRKGDEVVAIEVKYAEQFAFFAGTLQKVIDKLVAKTHAIPELSSGRLSLLLAIATDTPGIYADITGKLESNLPSTPFPMQLRVFNVADLKKELKLNG